MTDNIVEEVRRIREQLIERHGGIDGYFEHCQAIDRAWARKAANRGRSRSGKSRKTQRPTKPTRTAQRRRVRAT
jgi:hypothetical protein